jgi:hypothetical protein
VSHVSPSPDFTPATTLGRLKLGAGSVEGAGPGASLWLLALTSLTLVFASLLLLGLLAQSSLVGGAVGGFATAIATVTGGLGAVAMGYVLLAAHRAGYLRAPRVEHTSPAPAVPDGLRVAPVVPAGLAYRKRQQREAERAERRKQARAIDAVGTSRQVSPVSAPVSVPARPTPAPQAAAEPVAPVPAPMARPVASLSFPRLDPPRVRPRAQAALLQVGATSVRAPFAPPRPHLLMPQGSAAGMTGSSAPGQEVR